jgi:hypothetical protein
VTNENIVLNADAFTDKGMTGDLAAFPHRRVFLDLDEGPDFCLISNFASVEIDEFGELDVFSQLNVGGYAHKRIHK